jgi:hypothetical protein
MKQPERVIESVLLVAVNAGWFGFGPDLVALDLEIEVGLAGANRFAFEVLDVCGKVAGCAEPVGDWKYTAREPEAVIAVRAALCAPMAVWYIPVMNAERLAEQTGAVEMTVLYLRPAAARRSRCGVFTSGCP